MNLTVTIEQEDRIIAVHTEPVIKSEDVSSVVHNAIEKARENTDKPLWGMEISVHVS